LKPIHEVYTGFFGSKDIFHTFVDAFHGLKPMSLHPSNRTT